MGSLVYAKRCRVRGDGIVAMFSLECSVATAMPRTVRITYFP